MTVGDVGSGTFVQGGGSVTAFGLDIGHQTSGTGAVNLSGGTFSVSRGDAVIGDAGSGTFLHNGGKATANFAGGLKVGGESGGTGIYLLSAGKLIVGSGSGGGTIIGNGAGSGAFIQTGGTGVFSGGLTVASLFAGAGSFTLSGGTDTISGDTVIADAGVGAYRQSGGTATFAGKLTIANNFTASGTFALNGGSAVVRGEIDVGVGATTSGESSNFNAGGDRGAFEEREREYWRELQDRYRRAPRHSVSTAAASSKSIHILPSEARKTAAPVRSSMSPPGGQRGLLDEDAFASAASNAPGGQTGGVRHIWSSPVRRLRSRSTER